MKKRIAGFTTITVMIITFLSSIAYGYYNAYENVKQIKALIRRGMYIEAIRDCNNTISWHDLSEGDIILLTQLKETAEQRYRDYVNGTGVYYNATAEINQIRQFIDQGLYLEAMRDCENTAEWHYLSPDDISIINNMYDVANNNYSTYMRGVNQKYLTALNSGTLDKHDIINDAAIIINRPTSYQRSMIGISDYVTSDEQDTKDGDYIIIPHYASSVIKIWKLSGNHPLIMYEDYLYYNKIASNGCAVEYTCFDPEIWPRSKIVITAPNGSRLEHIPMYNTK